MAGAQAAPLDEVQYSDPNVLAYWQGVHANSVHGYLSESPFFDHTSKNGVLWGQALNDGNTLQLYSDRQRLEQTLRQRPGTEFMIVGEPQPVQDPEQGPDTGIWVIRKQERSKRAPPRDDELTTLGTYYIANQNIYQAPSAFDVIGNHLLSVTTSLSKFMEQAAPLPKYEPATGYSWLSSSDAAAAQQSASASREGSVGPEASSQPIASMASTSQTASTTAGPAADPLSDMLLEQSLRLAMTYGDEYTDENPLLGEPGNFVFTHTKDLLKTRQAQAEAAAAKAKEKEAAAKARAVPAAFSTKPKDNMSAIKEKRKNLKRRRKSKGHMSPTTASATASPAAMATPEAL